MSVVSCGTTILYKYPREKTLQAHINGSRSYIFKIWFMIQYMKYVPFVIFCAALPPRKRTDIFINNNDVRKNILYIFAWGLHHMTYTNNQTNKCFFSLFWALLLFSMHGELTFFKCIWYNSLDFPLISAEHLKVWRFLSDSLSLFLVFPLLSCPYLVSSCSCHHL